jgi:hypothetical protein
MTLGSSWLRYSEKFLRILQDIRLRPLTRTLLQIIYSKLYQCDVATVFRIGLHLHGFFFPEKKVIVNLLWKKVQVVYCGGLYQLNWTHSPYASTVLHVHRSWDANDWFINEWQILNVLQLFLNMFHNIYELTFIIILWIYQFLLFCWISKMLNATVQAKWIGSYYVWFIVE